MELKHIVTIGSVVIIAACLGVRLLQISLAGWDSRFLPGNVMLGLSAVLWGAGYALQQRPQGGRKPQMEGIRHE